MSKSPLIVIAIDGYSSCGKSTLARDLASHLHYKYLDSGAMYRAVTFYCLQQNIDVNNKSEVIAALDNVDIGFKVDNGVNLTVLNGKIVEEEIRSMAVSQQVSEVATIPEVRKKMVAIQQKLGERKGIVMDGRDITTVVFPEAELKIFVTADENVRTERRYQELKNKGKEVNRDVVKKNLKHRDFIDTTRKHSPLLQHPDAYLLDNTYLDRQEQLDVVLSYYDYIISTIE